MKKIFAISLIAMTAVTAANAEIASKAYVDQQDDAVEAIIGALTDLDTTAKGSVVAAINEVNTAVGNVDFSGKADKATGLTGATKTKITYNDQGIVTAGADLAASDIPTLTLEKISDSGALAALDEVAESNLASALATKINGKADSATTLAGYGITDAYTKTEADTAFVEAPSTAMTAGTYPKVTVDTQGLVTAGASLSASDIPDLSLAKITDVTATASEVNQLHGKTLGTAAEAAVATGTGAAGVTDDGTGLVTADQVYEYVAANAGASNFIEDSVTDAVTNKAPSENAVHDALALKEDVISATNKVDVAFIDEANYASSGLKTTLDAAYDAKNAASTAIAALDDTSGAAQSGKWVTAVTQTDGKITATMDDPLAAFTKLGENAGDGVYALTATASNGTITGYKWELIQRAE